MIVFGLMISLWLFTSVAMLTALVKISMDIDKIVKEEINKE